MKWHPVNFPPEVVSHADWEVTVPPVIVNVIGESLAKPFPVTRTTLPMWVARRE